MSLCHLPLIRSCFAVLGAAVVLSASGLRAQTAINIVNPDFEIGGVADGNFSNNNGVIPSGWTATTAITGFFYGYFNPTGTTYTGTDGSGAVGAMSGPNVFYFGSAINDEGIQQTLTTTFAPNTDYTLTVAVGTRLGGLANTASLRMELLAGSTVLATATVRNGTANTFVDFSTNFNSATAGSSYFSAYGQALTIRLLESDIGFAGELDIDQVRLTATSAIPEPATTATLIGACALLGAAPLRRRSSLP
jgi:hypothetical protein